MPRGSEALGDHFDLARNPVPDEHGASQLFDYGEFMGHSPARRMYSACSLVGAVRFCIQLLLQIVDVSQCVRVNRV